MFGRGFPLQEKGAPIKAATLNGPIKALSGLLKLRVGPGLLLRWLGEVPVIELDGSLLGVAFAAAPAGGVDARSGTTTFAGDFTRWTFAGGDFGPTDPARAITARNPWAAAVPGGALCLLVSWSGAWWVVGWECS